MTDLNVRNLVGWSMVYATYGNVCLNILVVIAKYAFVFHRQGKLKYLGMMQRRKIAQQLKIKRTNEGVAYLPG